MYVSKINFPVNFQNTKKRLAIRMTWGDTSSYRSIYSAKVIFFVGLPVTRGADNTTGEKPVSLMNLSRLIILQLTFIPSYIAWFLPLHIVFHYGVPIFLAIIVI